MQNFNITINATLAISEYGVSEKTTVYSRASKNWPIFFNFVGHILRKELLNSPFNLYTLYILIHIFVGKLFYCIIEDIVKYFLETFFIILLKLLYNLVSVIESLRVGKIRGK